jgi:hypothetical protein
VELLRLLDGLLAPLRGAGEVGLPGSAKGAAAFVPARSAV